MKLTRQRKIFIGILAFFIMLAISLLLIPSFKSVKAETSDEYDKYNFTLITNDDGESSYRIAAKPVYRSEMDFVVIPDTYNGLPVTEIAGSGFISCTNLSKVILPASVKTIGNNAFMNCPNLVYIGMPNVQSIGTNAFSMCTKLERLFIPHSVTEVGANILRNNANTVYVQKSVQEVNELWSSTWSTYFTGEIEYESAPENTIRYRKILAPDNQTVVGYEIKEEQYLAAIDTDVVIYNCACLDEELGYLPVLNICSEAFLYTQVNSLTIKDRHNDEPEVPSFNHKMNIRSNAFLYSFVNEINFEVSVSFNHPEGLQMNNPKSIHDGQAIVGDSNGFSTRVFEESLINSITLPTDMELITERMFYNCTNLANIKIYGEEYDSTNLLPKVQIIGIGAFSSCKSLSNITIPESVVVVGESAFSNIEGYKLDINVNFYEAELPDGWSENWTKDNDELVNINFKPLTDIEIILFDNEKINISVIPGKPMPELNIKIERDGYIFGGIYSREEDGGFQYYNINLESARAWEEGDPVILQVKWSLRNYTITYENLLDGTNPTINPVSYTIESKSITFAKPDGRNGYTGTWDIDSIENGTTGDIVVKAVWQTIEYTITYTNLLDGTNPVTNPDSYTIESETIIFANPYGRQGYAGSWDVQSIETGSTGNKIIAAVWDIIEYTITYDVDWKGNVNPNPTKYTVLDSFTFIKLEADGYTFKWNTEKISKGTTGNLTVIGTWKVIEYSITYNVDLKGQSNPNPTKYTVEDEIIFKNLTANGYTFTWNPKVINTGTTGNLTVVGTWNAIEYNITYNVDLKGQGNPNPTKYTVEDEITFVKLESDGYTFKWNPEKISKGTTGNLTVIGTWKAIEYSITYNADLKGQSNPNPTKYTVEDEITFIKLEKAGYSFDWTPFKIEKGTTGNLTVTGNWNRLEYNIKYDVDWKGLSNPNKLAYNVDDDFTFIKLEKQGYEFEWIPAKITSGTTGDINVKGVWKPILYKIIYNTWEGTINPNANSYTVERPVIFKEATYPGYKVTWDIESTVGHFELLTVTASYNEKSLDECYNNGVYEIYTWNQFSSIKNHPNYGSGKTYNLMQNISARGIVISPFVDFRGVLNGNNYLISSYTLNMTSKNIGLFSQNSGKIQNLKLMTSIHVSGDYSNINCGVFAGINSGEITNCTIGANALRPAFRCYASGVSYFGGIAGYNKGTISNCRISEDIIGSSNMGGIVGYNEGEISYCSNYGLIDFDYNNYNSCVGGIVGVQNSGNTNNCFYKGKMVFSNYRSDNYSTIKEDREIQMCVGIIIGYLRGGSQSNNNYEFLDPIVYDKIIYASTLSVVTWKTGVWPFQKTHTHNQALYVKNEVCGRTG